jgi:hypothetical protein
MHATKAGPERLLWLLDEADRLSEPLREWLEAGISCWLKGASLDDALGLSCQPGQRKPANRIRTDQRNAALREAWSLCAGTPWQRSRALSELIGRLPTIQRRHQAGHLPTSEVNRLLCIAADHGALPEKPNQIHLICADSPR